MFLHRTAQSAIWHFHFPHNIYTFSQLHRTMQSRNPLLDSNIRPITARQHKNLLNYSVTMWCWPEHGGRQRDRDLHAVFGGDEVLQGSAHVTQLGHGAAPQHGALQLLSLHLLFLLLDLLLQASTAVPQLRQPLLQLGYLLLHRFQHFHLWCRFYSPQYV